MRAVLSILEREYGPWGDLLSGASTAGYAFQGREWDAEIGMFYFRARYYNAACRCVGFRRSDWLRRGTEFHAIRRITIPFGLSIHSDCVSSDEQPESQNRPR